MSKSMLRIHPIARGHRTRLSRSDSIQAKRRAERSRSGMVAVQMAEWWPQTLPDALKRQVQVVTRSVEPVALQPQMNREQQSVESAAQMETGRSVLSARPAAPGP